MSGLFALLTLPALAGADAVLEGRTLRYEDGPRLLWQRTYPAALGDLTGPLNVGNLTYLGVGPQVYVLNADSTVQARVDLPGMVTSLDASSGTVRVTTQGDGYTERFTLGDAAQGAPVQERVVPPPNPEITGWLARAADAVPQAQLAQAGAQDPTNPFTALRQANLANIQGDTFSALSAVRRALSAQMPFPAWVMLAARLDSAGFPAAANLALDRAKRDAAERGFDPEISVSRATLSAYGNPSGYVGTLLAQNRLTRVGAWLAYLRELHPRFEGGPALYLRYADLLEAQGRGGEAEEWRQFTRTLRAGTLYNLGPDGTGQVRDAARLVTLALLLALAASFAALVARAWRVQGEDTRPLGGRWRSVLRRPLSRARRNTLAYASFGERLVLVTLALGLVAAVGGWQWTNHTGQGLRAAALTSGTYGGGWVTARLSDLNLRPSPDAALLAGLSAQLDGDDSVARAQYTRAQDTRAQTAGAGPDACALNNLGVIAAQRGDVPQSRESYRAALAIRPDLAAAAFNLGLNPGTPGTAFQQQYRPGQPRLCYPDQRSLARAVSGDLSVTLRRDLAQPLALLSDAPGQSARLGAALLGALALLAAIAFTLLIPRAATDARLRRPAVYRVLALLLPGAALLEGAWGGVLLLAWGATLAALAPLTGLIAYAQLLDPAQITTRNLLLAVLIGVYALNTLVFALIELRHARSTRRERAER
ncbi:hypothetical protein [Deinococcus sp. QL22]|uniref:hypothetical protein n=1 Tax=Deinococcus sp. QL22 TaxID=2939437 RepID=UPI0020179783|nr:hypothetical protein [Deinococcus sp. QL22]UQN07641.1 hypothetical protein M1R55_07085 [Deinococcus sp. QL22]